MLDRRELLAAAGVGLVAPFGSAAAAAAQGKRPAPIAFAEREIAAAAAAASQPAPQVRFEIDPAMDPQSYRIGGSAASPTIVAGDAAGAMYGGLELADALRLALDHPAALADDRVHAPHVVRRGIKFNIPLDLRTPSYSDGSTSARANIPEVWERDFWASYFDEMARNRYNVLSLWSMHPFPSMVKVPEFPDVALDDVWRSKEPLGPAIFNTRGTDAVPARFLDNHEVVKTITIDAKIAFWRDVMQMAADRGIEVYVFTWNLFVYGAEGKYGITDSMTNATTTAYFRASVRELVRTYPLLAGVGITAGENLPTTHPGLSQEQWLWRTYGEGVRDALGPSPKRIFRLIHRFHETEAGEIEANWSRYPGYPDTFTYSYKYSVAHMYSSTRPPFIAEAEAYISPRLKTWLTVRNDDIYSFRWGDPAYAREYVLNMPPRELLAGFYMGPDGYCWGRDFLDRETANKKLGTARRLVMQKHWYSFAIWGRLAFDPTLTDGYFEAMLRARFAGVDAGKLYAAIAAASKIVPQTTRMFWKDIDLLWLPEACANSANPAGTAAFYTVTDFMKGWSMPGSGILSIRRWRYKLTQGMTLGRITPLDCASALAGWSDTALRLAGELRASPGAAGDELAQTIGDVEAMAHLGRYYAEKTWGACDLAMFDQTRRRTDQAGAIGHLERARDAWRRYAAVRDAQYVPNFFNRIGWIDLTALTAKTEEDILIARGWTPGTLPFDPAAPENRWATSLPKWTIND
jgi:hypothetical protein